MMGKRVQKNWDLLSGQTGAICLLGVTFLVGGLLGVLYVGLESQSGAEELRNYLIDYLSVLSNGTAEVSLWPLLRDRLSVLLLTLLLGSTPLGVLGLPVLFCIQGFRFGFSVTCFCRVFGGAGLFPAFALLGLPEIIWLPLLFLAGTRGLLLVRDMLTARRTGGGAVSMSGLWLRLGLYTVLLVVCVLIENMAVPVLLRAAAQVVL